MIEITIKDCPKHLLKIVDKNFVGYLPNEMRALKPRFDFSPPPEVHVTLEEYFRDVDVFSRYQPKKEMDTEWIAENEIHEEKA